MDNFEFIDVQNQPSKRKFQLNRVGITGLKKPTVVRRKKRKVHLMVKFDIYVDLPSDQKGSHMSRNAEVINNIVDQSVRNPVDSLENLGLKIVDELLISHEYATYAQVDMESDYFLEKSSPLGRKSLENYGLRASAKKGRNNGGTKTLGVEVMGMSVCPCAMETIRGLLSAAHPEHRDFLQEIPMLSHNQRNVTYVEVQTDPKYELEADDLIEITEMSQSSPTYEILKRNDEGKVVLNAHKNPKFVEDVVRDILHKIMEMYPDFPDDTRLTVKSSSRESIHKHDAYAERTTTFKELRKD